MRVYQEGKWTLVVTKAPLSGDLVRLEEKSVKDFLAANGIAPNYIGSSDITQASNLTQVFAVGRLEADTHYYYAIISESTDATIIRRRTEIGADTPHSSRTPPVGPSEIRGMTRKSSSTCTGRAARKAK